MFYFYTMVLPPKDVKCISEKSTSLDVTWNAPSQDSSINILYIYDLHKGKHYVCEFP